MVFLRFFHRKSWPLYCSALLAIQSHLVLAQPSPSPASKAGCVNEAGVPAKLKRSKVYKDVPFKQGEVAKYELKYGALKVLVGYGFMRVQPPVKYSVSSGKDANGKLVKARLYHRVFQAEAYTGEWYKMVFRAKDKILAYSRPWDFGVSKFYISQNEHKPFVREYRREKWLEFDHFQCQVNTKENEYTKNKKREGIHELHSGALDALGAFYKLRTFDYEVGKDVKFPVYTSEKNWLLVAKPVALESVKVNAGTFETVKLSLQTYLGEELQQKGELSVWVAKDHPNKPLIKIEGEVTFGSVYLLLESFKAGR